MSEEFDCAEFRLVDLISVMEEDVEITVIHNGDEISLEQACDRYNYYVTNVSFGANYDRDVEVYITIEEPDIRKEN